MQIRKLLLCLAALLCCQVSFANGYQVMLQGNRQSGMGNVGVGFMPSAGSIWFNPGAMSFLDRNVISIGIQPVFSNITYRALESNAFTHSESPAGTPFHLYGAWKINDKLSAGLAVVTPYGSTIVYPDDWSGKMALQEISLQAIYIQPTLSYKIHDKVSVGVGFDVVYGGVNLQRVASEAFSNDINVELDGSTVSYGFNAGIYAQPSEKFSIGMTYRSKVNMALEEGSAMFTNIPSVASALFPANGETKFDAELPLPSVAAIGVGFYPNEKLSIGFDVNYVQWSAYQELKFKFYDPLPGMEQEGDRYVSASERKYQDSWMFNLGVEYHLNDKVDLRAGTYFDMSPVKDGYLTPETPDANALGLTAGASYKITDKFVVDASILFVDKAQRENIAVRDSNGNVVTGGVDGVYKARGIVPGISLNYLF
ncbi:outer membrane protein transport protein [Limibacter armeniacum]|uniref:OmpP1/FadL family transporter n=1 Tax=Limibacter armeniacum TaxID=466084 RepID=UPI002FE5D9EF